MYHNEIHVHSLLNLTDLKMLTLQSGGAFKCLSEGLTIKLCQLICHSSLFISYKQLADDDWCKNFDKVYCWIVILVKIIFMREIVQSKQLVDKISVLITNPTQSPTGRDCIAPEINADMYVYFCGCITWTFKFENCNNFTETKTWVCAFVNDWREQKMRADSSYLVSTLKTTSMVF